MPRKIMIVDHKIRKLNMKATSARKYNLPNFSGYNDRTTEQSTNRPNDYPTR